ncbi:hypothetical protein D1B33_07530 [Lysinibacillus yapensis]|uniref:Glycosyl-4,4'-diaponeurosporenoate acyltransferase n=1 Tax=Ureibacillus yapensis TaxID=2304605 RepID=A0A396SJ05_9BACL|nr:hypothetical protein [Lysinibacillus yapensis]RHW38715.1 hypothetical protein D1B33_07530 [Lysinibacillus yapensis]
MNFDTKYLIRWGIPGWTTVLTLFPYFFFTFLDNFKGLFDLSAVDILTLGAALAFLGVPLGYVLNQVHHSIFWVIPKIRYKNWDAYFKEEIKVDENHLSKNDFKKERYRYLLSKKHEIGGVMSSFYASSFAILMTNIFHGSTMWSWVYFIIVSALTVIFTLSRNYSSRNVEYYFSEYLLQEPPDSSQPSQPNNGGN